MLSARRLPDPFLKSPSVAEGHFIEQRHIYLADAVMLATPASQMKAMPDWVIKLLKAAADQVIKALNIALLRLQNKEIDETNKAKIAEAVIHAKWLKEIVTIGDNMKDLYEKYYDELKAVKEVVVLIGELRDLVRQEKDFLTTYAAIIGSMGNAVFTTEERAFVVEHANNILTAARSNIGDIKSLITSFETTMQDADRITIIKTVNRKLSADLATMNQLRSELAMVIGVRQQNEVSEVELLFE